MAVNALSSRVLRNATADRLAYIEQGWIQFINDHKRYIRQKSKIISLTTYDLARYRFRPIEYFNDLVQCGQNLVWVYCMINDIRTVEDFNQTLSKLWLPDPKVITDLRRSYEQTAAYQATA